MKLAAGAVDNTVVKPGEVFSFNELAAELDYKEAKTFSDGGVGFANGGGLCQVSSTLYMAAQYAGLEIEERHPHYAVLPYIKPGFDATVWFGDEYGYGVQDMKFRNTTDAPVLIREFVDDKGYLTAQILGQPTGKEVEMTTEKIFEDTTRGIRWDTFKKVTENGEVTFNDMIHTYTYSLQPARRRRTGRTTTRRPPGCRAGTTRATPPAGPKSPSRPMRAAGPNIRDRGTP